MNTKKYNVILYVISITIVATITIQFFWNYKNYQTNKQRVINEIQLSLDNAVEEYYSSIAETSFVKIITTNCKECDEAEEINDVLKKLKTSANTKVDRNHREFNQKKHFKDDSKKDTNKRKPFQFSKNLIAKDSSSPKTPFIKKKDSMTSFIYFEGQKAADNLKFIANLKPVLLSLLDETVDYKKLDALIQHQLIQKGLAIENSFQHIKNDSIFYKTKDTLLATTILSASSKSTYIKKNEQFKLLYENPNKVTLKRSTFGIFLSFLLSVAVIFSLFFLLNIIKKQKQLAFIKNDLISNITHEFKTPIATVNTAIEAIENFNAIDDKEKTKKYLNVSSFQLKKLNQMVEKLLETATLDSEQLLLKKESVDIVAITERIVNKFTLLTSEKEIVFTSNLKPIYCNVDVFHFENVLSNLIDNAIKYGGNQIEVNINSVLNATQIIVADNGGGIDKNQQELLFNKFYRVPQGNTHNVKGFGIGLYYCKQIIEKHNGNITLTANKRETMFKINLPNE